MMMPTSRTWTRVCTMIAGVMILFMASSWSDLCAEQITPRWQAHTKKAAKGKDKLVTKTATFFGTPSHEEFVAVGTLPNGDILAAGNAWGPDFPEMVEVEVIGKGEWYDVPEYVNGQAMITNKRGKLKPAELAHDYPNKAGFLVVFSPDLQKVKRLIRFDWGVATINKMAIMENGDIIIGGRSQQAFVDSIVENIPAERRYKYDHPDLEDPGDRYAKIKDPEKRAQKEARWREHMRNSFGPVTYEGVEQAGDAYITRLIGLTKPSWVVTLKGFRDIKAEFTIIKNKWMAFSSHGVRRVDLETGQPDYDYGKYSSRDALCFNKFTGEYYRGGDTNTSTGREPWRKPYLHCHGEDGVRKWSAYNWDPHMVGHDRFRLVSDSSVRHVIPDHEGYLWVAFWSDGGNTVATKAPWDITKGPRYSNPMGMSSWGAGVGGFSHFVRWNPDKLDFATYCFWAAYMPRTGMPNSAGVSRMGVLKDNSMVITGGAASCLIQTPGAYVKWTDKIWDQKWQAENHGFGYGGDYITVFNKTLTGMRFSSYLPGMKFRNWGDGPDNSFLIVTAALGPDDNRHDESQGGPNKVPVVNAMQPEFAGGRMDAHIILLHDPDEDAVK